MKKIPALILFAALLISSGLCAQTKLIFHKSHSGSDRSFRIAFDNYDTDLEGSDFGMAPERTVRTAALDSLIFISDSVTIMVTSERCTRERGARQLPTTKWRAGKDTLYNHPLFNRKNGIAYIKKQLRDFNFQNPVDSVKFVEEITEDSLGYQPPVASINGGSGGSGNTPAVWLGLILLFSVLTSGAYCLARKYLGNSLLPGARQ